MNQTGKVATTTALVWHSELADTLGTSRRRVAVGATIAGIAVVGLGAALGVATASSVDATVPGDLSRMIIQTALSGALLSATLISLIIALIAPTRSSLDHLICMLPVSTGARLVGTAIPTMVVAFTAATAMSMPALLVAVRVLTSSSAVVFTGLLLLGVLLTQVLLQAVLHVAQSLLTSAFRLPASVSLTFSGVIVMGLSLAGFGRQLFTIPRLSNPNAPSLELPGIISDLAVGKCPILNILMFTAWMSTALIAIVIASRVRNDKRSAPGRVAFPCNELVRGAKGILLTQVLIIIRAPQTPLALIGGFALLAVITSVPPTTLPSELRTSLAAAIPSAGCALILFGPGRILPWTWLGPTTGSERSWWILPLASAHLSLAMVVWVLMTSVELALGLLPNADLPAMLARGLLLFSAAFLAGMLVPWSETQQLSGTVGLIVAMGMYLATNFLAGQIALVSTDAVGTILSLLLAGVLAGFAALVARRLTRTR